MMKKSYEMKASNTISFYSNGWNSSDFYLIQKVEEDANVSNHRTLPKAFFMKSRPNAIKNINDRSIPMPVSKEVSSGNKKLIIDLRKK